MTVAVPVGRVNVSVPVLDAEGSVNVSVVVEVVVTVGRVKVSVAVSDVVGRVYDSVSIVVGSVNVSV